MYYTHNICYNYDDDDDDDDADDDGGDDDDMGIIMTTIYGCARP